MPFITDYDTFDKFIEEKEALYNGFISDINNPKLDNNFFLLFESEKINTYRYKNIIESDWYNFANQINLNNEFYEKYVFEIPESFKTEYEKILENNYFELKIETKLKIMKFWNIPPSNWLFDLLFVKEIEPIDVGSEKIPECVYQKEKFI